MLRLLILFLLISSNLQAQAFFFKKKGPPKAKVQLIKPQVLIEDRYQGSTGITYVKLIIDAPNTSPLIRVISFVDELDNQGVEKIVWLVKDSQAKKKEEKNTPESLKGFRRVLPSKTEKFINKAVENYDIDYDPTKAYERSLWDKHLLSLAFFFDKQMIFGDNKKKRQHLLELTYNDGSKKALRIDDKIYTDETKDMPFVDPKTQKPSLSREAQHQQFQQRQPQQQQSDPASGNFRPANLQDGNQNIDAFKDVEMQQREFQEVQQNMQRQQQEQYQMLFDEETPLL